MITFVVLFAFFQFISCESKALDFLEGFVLGVESDIGNLTECVDESVLTFEDFEKAIEDLDYGFRHLDVEHIEKGIQEIADGLEELNLAIKDCNAEELISDIKKLIEEIEEGTIGIIKIIVHEAINIFSHGKDITKDFQNMISNWKAGEWRASGYYFGKIVGVLLEGV